jgi:uncharacterized protein with NAD-binding domain and iron-sulfur cluster
VSPARKPRIAILGGGVGSVTAAIQLSQPGWEEHYSSITLYQQGWRLGGKGASGRGSDLRIEEHGLHIWFGFYENAFSMLHDAHEELDALAARRGGEPRWPLVFGNVKDSFRPTTEISLTDFDGCSWKLWTADFFPDDDDNPWAQTRPDGAPPEDASVVYYAARCLQLAADLALSIERSNPGPVITTDPTAGVRRVAGGIEDAIASLWRALGGDLHGALSAAASTLEVLAVEGGTEPAVLAALDVVARTLDFGLRVVRGRFDQLVRSHDSLRRAVYVVDLMIAIVRGLIEDDVISQNSFAVVDGTDFSEWLMSHGAARESAECALVRAVVYDLPFAYRGGDPQRPACSAGTALRGLMRTFFTYRGALMWKMNSGMGDVVFAPLYELLVKRGVEVKFFHRVEQLRLKDGQVEEIEIDVQADVPRTVKPRSYLDPHYPDAPAVWPADPGPMLGAASPVSPDVYESYFADRSATHFKTIRLRRGAAEASEGFELVVFGLSIGSVPYVAPELAERSAAWRAALDRVETVPTQAIQLWLDRPGTSISGGLVEGIVVGGYTEPFDTWADMAHLVPQERVPGSKTVAYFCNALADCTPPPRGQADQWLADQKALVLSQAHRFLDSEIRWLWPGATDPFTGRFQWERLVAPGGTVGAARLEAQYWRANVEPSERYVLSVPGSSAYRIPPDDTGFANLYAVGDWTSCTIDAGCVEAAVISGMTAANAIHTAHGDPAKVVPIVGANGP